MKYGSFFKMVVIIVMSAFIISCQKTDDIVSNNEFSTDSAEDVLLKSANNSKGFVHGIVVDIDGKDYYFAGPPIDKDDPEGAIDVPGHYWVQSGPNKVVAKHYNTGPFGAPKWWSSDAMDGDLLYIVHGIIDTWSEEKAKQYYKKGFVHYHEFVKVAGGELHPDKVVWLKHTAVTRFTLDGGPVEPPNEHEVMQGIDFEFPNNSFNPY
jgi:hypothetical protein